MTSSSGLLGNRRSVLNDITQDIRSVDVCFKQAAEFQQQLLEKQSISDERLQSNIAQERNLDNDVRDMKLELEQLQGKLVEASGLRDRLLQCKEGLVTKCSERQNLVKDSVVDNTGRSRLVEWYEERLGLQLRRIQDTDVPVYGLVFSHLSPYSPASATLRFTIEGRDYKFLGSDPSLPEDVLKRSEEQLNRTQDFQAFFCYIRRQFSRVFEVG